MIKRDGGIRRGYDVPKMLALGAGVEGVKIHMEYMQKTFQKAMHMTNCKTLKDFSSEILFQNY